MTPPILGCEEWRVYIAERGGGKLLAELPYDSLTVGRVLGDISSASVSILADLDSACAPLLADVEPWQHEIVCFRNGDEAWAGPLTEPVWEPLTLTLPARDLFSWFERRDLPIDRSFTTTDLTDIFGVYLADAYGLEPTPNITFVRNGDSGVQGARSVTTVSSTRTADALRELSRSGVNFTMVGRILIYGGDPIPPEPVFVLRDECVENAKVRKAGLNTANRVTVKGGTPTGTTTQVTSTAGNPDARLGLLQLTVTESTILDPGSAMGAAANRLRFLDPSPRYLDCDLLENTPIRFSDLRPGIRVDAALTVGFRTEVGPYRLSAVSVSVSADGSEKISGTFVPLEVPV
jgi:hypothetical protein